MHMKERLWEAHDLIVKAWTSHDGPFNWEGKFFHHRQVNVWPRPWQQPHPPIWITTGNPANAVEIAATGHVGATFITGFEGCKAIFDGYRRGWREAHGGEAPPDRLAYMGLCYVGETDAEGFAGAEKLLWYLTANKSPPHFRNFPGYLSPEARAAIHQAGVPRLEQHRIPEVETQIRVGNMFAGNPDTVFDQIKAFRDHVGPFGHLMIMGQAGFMQYDETVRGLTLFAREVHPRLKELTRSPSPASPV
jgi:alkanesulfonate monooxygenase SsuD/methylene tetrahydromethanopterin reductase-like flavin-dependent oxidoreductase (luciferase family)